MSTDLQIAIEGTAKPGGVTRRWAIARGEVFVNPFIDASKAAERIKLREGRIIGGGKLTEERPIRLVLRSPSFPGCAMIERRINQRFPTQSYKVATGKNASIIELRVPPNYRNDYRHFLDLVMHLPLTTGAAATDIKVRYALHRIQQDGAQHHELALLLEAIGRQIVPMLQPHYNSKNLKAAFYVSRTGLRLGDETAGEVMLNFAVMDNSPLQMFAIEELGRHRGLLDAVSVLRNLLENKDELVRVAAYEALLKHGDYGKIQRIKISDYFKLDLVDSKGKKVIYATQTQEAKIVIFGGSIPVSNPVFFCPKDELVTISNVKIGEQTKLVVYRKLPYKDIYSEPLHTDLTVASLIKTLGSPAKIGRDRKIEGLALTYSQVLRVLYGMCKSNGIKAKFVLQPLPQMQRIYQEASTGDTPGS